jgi:hypothetical protein
MFSHRRSLLIVVAVLALISSACGSDDTIAQPDGEASAGLPTDPDSGTRPTEEAQSEPGDTGPGDASVSDLPGAPLRVISVDFSAGVVTLTNTGTADYDLTGHWLCNRPSYSELPGQVLEPGATLDVSVNGLSAGGGEVAIYVSNNFGSSDDIVTYVGWGSGGGRQSVAEAAQVWSGDPVQPASDIITLSGDPGAAAGWG